MLQVMMMELLHTRLEQETMHRDLTTALALIRELPSALARKDDGTAFTWGPDGGDLFEQARETFSPLSSFCRFCSPPPLPFSAPSPSLPATHPTHTQDPACRGCFLLHSRICILWKNLLVYSTACVRGSNQLPKVEPHLLPPPPHPLH